MWEDSIVKEVRQQRLIIEAEAGNDWEEIIARAIEFQRQFAAALPPSLPSQQDTHYDVADFEADLYTPKILKTSAC